MLVKCFLTAKSLNDYSVEPKVIEQPIVWTQKKDYGTVPKYLEKIKEQTQREYEHLRALQQQEQEQQDADK